MRRKPTDTYREGDGVKRRWTDNVIEKETETEAETDRQTDRNQVSSINKRRTWPEERNCVYGLHPRKPRFLLPNDELHLPPASSVNQDGHQLRVAGPKDAMGPDSDSK